MLATSQRENEMICARQSGDFCGGEFEFDDGAAVKLEEEYNAARAQAQDESERRSRSGSRRLSEESSSGSSSELCSSSSASRATKIEADRNRSDREQSCETDNCIIDDNDSCELSCETGSEAAEPIVDPVKLLLVSSCARNEYLPEREYLSDPDFHDERPAAKCSARRRRKLRRERSELDKSNLYQKSSASTGANDDAEEDRESQSEASSEMKPSEFVSVSVDKSQSAHSLGQQQVSCETASEARADSFASDGTDRTTSVAFDGSSSSPSSRAAIVSRESSPVAESTSFLDELVADILDQALLGSAAAAARIEPEEDTNEEEEETRKKSVFTSSMCRPFPSLDEQINACRKIVAQLHGSDAVAATRSLSVNLAAACEGTASEARHFRSEPSGLGRWGLAESAQSDDGGDERHGNDCATAATGSLTDTEFEAPLQAQRLRGGGGGSQAPPSGRRRRRKLSRANTDVATSQRQSSYKPFLARDTLGADGSLRNEHTNVPPEVCRRLAADLASPRASSKGVRLFARRRMQSADWIVCGSEPRSDVSKPTNEANALEAPEDERLRAASMDTQQPMIVMVADESGAQVVEFAAAVETLPPPPPPSTTDRADGEKEPTRPPGEWGGVDSHSLRVGRLKRATVTRTRSFSASSRRVIECDSPDLLTASSTSSTSSSTSSDSEDSSAPRASLEPVAATSDCARQQQQSWLSTSGWHAPPAAHVRWLTHTEPTSGAPILSAAAAAPVNYDDDNEEPVGEQIQCSAAVAYRTRYKCSARTFAVSGGGDGRHFRSAVRVDDRNGWAAVDEFRRCCRLGRSCLGPMRATTFSFTAAPPPPPTRAITVATETTTTETKTQTDPLTGAFGADWPTDKRRPFVDSIGSGGADLGPESGANFFQAHLPATTTTTATTNQCPCQCHCEGE